MDRLLWRRGAAVSHEELQPANVRSQEDIVEFLCGVVVVFESSRNRSRVRLRPVFVHDLYPGIQTVF
jgi:hypothetical protein